MSDPFYFPQIKFELPSGPDGSLDSQELRRVAGIPNDYQLYVALSGDDYVPIRPGERFILSSEHAIWFCSPPVERSPEQAACGQSRMYSGGYLIFPFDTLDNWIPTRRLIQDRDGRGTEKRTWLRSFNMWPMDPSSATRVMAAAIIHTTDHGLVQHVSFDDTDDEQPDDRLKTPEEIYQEALAGALQDVFGEQADTVLRAISQEPPASSPPTFPVLSPPATTPATSPSGTVPPPRPVQSDPQPDARLAATAPAPSDNTRRKRERRQASKATAPAKTQPPATIRKLRVRRDLQWPEDKSSNDSDS